MKILKYIACAAAGSLLLAACQHPEVQIVDFDTFHPFSVKSADTFMENGELNPDVRMMDIGDEEPDTKIAAATGQGIVKELLGSINSNSLIHIAGTYKGQDADGNPLTLSGKLLVPAKGPVKNLVIVSHFTIGANFECPSESFPLEGIIASKGYAVAIADYIGFGVTSHMVHPYMHTASTAQSVVDMALAVKPYLEHIDRAPESEKVILVGYSQGGSTTMAVMKLLQERYATELPIEKVYAGGGPYDLNATFDLSMQEDITGIPCAIPMIVQGISVGEALDLDMADFFQPKLLENYDEWINSKKYTVGQINKLMGAKALHELMTEEGRDKSSSQTALLYKALLHNSTLNFQPRAHIYMFHSREDKTVPFVNALKAEQYFKHSNISFDFGEYGSHSMGALRFIFNVAKDL